jgi:hypothetical protein
MVDALFALILLEVQLGKDNLMQHHYDALSSEQQARIDQVIRDRRLSPEQQARVDLAICERRQAQLVRFHEHFPLLSNGGWSIYLILALLLFCTAAGIIGRAPGAEKMRLYRISVMNDEPR